MKAPSELNCGVGAERIIDCFAHFLASDLSLILLTFYITDINVSV